MSFHTKADFSKETTATIGFLVEGRAVVSYLIYGNRSIRFFAQLWVYA